MHKKFIIILILALINLSCSRFFNVVREDITECDQTEQIKIKLKDGSEIIGDRFSFDVTEIDTSIVIITEQTIKSIPMNDIEKFYIDKTDYPMTIFMSLGIFVGVIFVFGAIAFHDFSVGG